MVKLRDDIPRLTPDTPEWSAALAIEPVLLNDPVHWYNYHGTLIHIKYSKTGIAEKDDLPPLFLFYNIETGEDVWLTLDEVTALILPND